MEQGILRGVVTGCAVMVLLSAPGCNCGPYDEQLARIDAIARADGGPSADAGGGRDGGGDADAGTADAAVADAGGADGSVVDAGVADAGPRDGGVRDAGVFDAGPFDGGLRDAGFTADAGAGTVDASVDLDGGVAGCGKQGQPCPCCTGFFCCMSATGAETCIDMMQVCIN